MGKTGILFEYALKLASTCAPLAWLAFSQGIYAQGAIQGAIEGEGASNTVNVDAYNDLVQNYCVDCHNLEDFSGGIAFDLMNIDHVGGDLEVWETAVNKLRGRLMPPAGQPQPQQADIDSLVNYLEVSIDANGAVPHVGNVPIQRLNRTEFSASVKGLVGVEIDPVQVLPMEIEVEGFDNIAGALAVSPSFLEQYISAARLAASLAIGEPVPKFSNTYYEVDAVSAANQADHRDGFPMGTRGGISFSHVFPADGEYRFNILDIDANLYPRGMETQATLIVLVDRKEVARVKIGGPEDLELADRDGPEGRAAIIAKITGIPAQIEAGSHEVIVTFIERSWAASNNQSESGRYSGVPRIQYGMEVEGPFEPTGLSLSDSRAKIFVCQAETADEERPCALRIAQNLATRAFRRPVTEADMDWLMPFYELGREEAGGFDSGVLELVTAILSSPDFLYRTILTAPKFDATRALTNLELASRLSFFLWSQGPDNELITLASEGQLSKPFVLEQQVLRMLNDPRAESLVENFALAWLNLDELDQVVPLDPEFTDGMRNNFETEIRMFLSSVLLEDRSVLDLLNADYTFVNASLASHYNIPDVFGPQFRQVKLADENRWGLLGKGAVLLRTSYGDRTSPVLRGAWVLERIVGTPPTPPPPNVETDLSIQDGEKATTVRARLEEHRANPTCQGCHGVIDPPGLALENFDETGRWREVDVSAGEKIDATTELTSGAILNGPIDLRHYLTSQPDQFPTTLTKRLMMYALNREVEYYDMPQIRKIVDSAAQDGYTFSAIITELVKSDAFLKQGADESLMNKAAISKLAMSNE